MSPATLIRLTIQTAFFQGLLASATIIAGCRKRNLVSIHTSSIFHYRKLGLLCGHVPVVEEIGIRYPCLKNFFFESIYNE